MRDFEADRKLCEAASHKNVKTGFVDGEFVISGLPTITDDEFIAQAREGWPAALREIKKLIARIRISAATNKELVRIIQESERENARIRIALHDAINRPMGVVPDSAVEFYDQDKECE